MNSKNILVVGCGGIGCELIKILHTNKCCNITLVDYDIISTSNLSRQFFFTTEDVNKYKCQVIAEKYKKWNANATVNYYKDDITNSSFDYNFYKKFDLVFNCLDNREARTFISRRCAFTKTSIIDGGSKAFLGQAWFYMTNIECYDCLDKQVDTSIPVCTIRSFPSTYEHCVIWTKEHFLVKLFAINNEVEIKELIKDIVKENCRVDDHDVQELTKTCMSIVELGVTEYDKDNVDLNQLCYKVAKLRANSFGIDALTEFETEAILGNIVPIVGTTNAIIASLMYQIGTDYLKGNVIHNFYLSNNARIINKVRYVKWKEDCKFCNSKKMLLHKKDSISIDTLIEKFEEYGTIGRIFDSNDVYYDKNYTVETDYTIELHNNEILDVQIDSKIFTLLLIEGDDNKIADVR